MLTQALIREFKAQVGEDDVFADPADLMTYSYDAAPLDPVLPASSFEIVSKGEISGQFAGFRMELVKTRMGPISLPGNSLSIGIKSSRPL